MRHAFRNEVSSSLSASGVDMQATDDNECRPHRVTLDYIVIHLISIKVRRPDPSGKYQELETRARYTDYESGGIAGMHPLIVCGRVTSRV